MFIYKYRLPYLNALRIFLFTYLKKGQFGFFRLGKVSGTSFLQAQNLVFDTIFCRKSLKLTNFKRIYSLECQNTQRVYLIILFVCIHSCATYKPQYKSEEDLNPYPYGKEIEKTFYLIGDAGYADAGASTPGLMGFKKAVDTASKGSYALFLGDNIYPVGMQKKDHPARKLSEHRLNVQLGAVKNFDGDIIFIPGNHDWYDEGIKGLRRQENYFETLLKDKKVFLPGKGCGLTDVEVSENVHLILIDSQWYLENWDNHPGINDDCPEIKTREQFFIEVEDLLKDHQNKTVIIALHHPLMTSGPHGGQFHAKKHLHPMQKKFPLPGIASLVALIRSSGGISIQDRNNERYNELADKLLTISRDAKNVIFVSGHEHSLQYHKKENIPQIISGSGAKESATKLAGDAQFTYGGQGFAILDVFKDGSSWVRYYAAKPQGNELMFQTEIHPPVPEVKVDTLPANFSPYTKASVYKKEETDRSGLYESIWGKHYRDIYGTEVTVPVVEIDTLYGGLTPVRMGGGHQSKTLRLVDKNGKEYNMRALKKSAVKFLQSVVFESVYVQDDLKNTLPEDLLLDFYTAAHPYTSFAIGALSDAIGVYHTNPRLYYVPKQKALGKYNKLYGDELYMIEERPMEEFENLDSFGEPDDIESTADLYKKLREDEKYKLDERAYVRARLFDMLIGDWDRHDDQWRWAEFEKENGDHIFKPIPRDRDQAFSNFDGTLLTVMRTFLSGVRMMQPYRSRLKHLEIFNMEPLPMDRTLLRNTTEEDWISEARYIQEHLTDEIIETAFNILPAEVKDENIEAIKTHLKERRTKLVSIARDYSKILEKLAIVTGTDKDDYIEITRMASGKTNIKLYRIKDGEKADLISDKTYNRKHTKEIWVYGLDDDDIFEVSGKAGHPVFIRLIGGQNKDEYRIKNGRRISIYDHRTKESIVTENKGAKVRFTNAYYVNLFNFKKNEHASTNLLPAVGFNPDDGFKLGLRLVRTNFGFESNPFTSKHILGLNYFFATSGFEMIYDGEVANIKNQSFFIFGARATSPKFAQNFFGYGSDSPNFDDELGFDYNRVRISNLTAYAGLARRSNYGSDFSGRIKLEGIQVENTEGRFINDIATPEDFFERKYFSTAEVNYTFESYDNKLNPARGMYFSATAGYTFNVMELSRNFGFLKSAIEFYNRLISNNKLVLNTRVQTHLNFGNDFEFYQAAALGGFESLRGFRDERFTGKNSLVFNGNLRYSFNRFKTPILPLQIGIYGGYDYGRVWIGNDPDNLWQNAYGGGFWINVLDTLNTEFALFNSDDGLRFTFGFGFRF